MKKKERNGRITFHICHNCRYYIRSIDRLEKKAWRQSGDVNDGDQKCNVNKLNLIE